MAKKQLEWVGKARGWIGQHLAISGIIVFISLSALLSLFVGFKHFWAFTCFAYKPVGVLVICVFALCLVSWFVRRRFASWSEWVVLGAWVVGGVVVAGVLLYSAWGYFNGEASPESDVSSLAGSSMYEVLRTAIAAVGVITIGGGAAIAFRRQKTVEEQTALEKRKEDRATFSDLHARYQQAAGQLGSDTYMTRIAGVYALEALADEWAVHGNIQQRGVCIDLLCGYLQSTPPENTDQDSGEVLDGKVRETITTVISRHLQDPEADSSWSDHSYNFKGATFVNANFCEAHFSHAVNFISATFKGIALFEETTFKGPTFFVSATFKGIALFEGTTFGGETRFEGATFTDIALFEGTTFGGETRFEGATFEKGVPPEVSRLRGDAQG